MSKLINIVQPSCLYLGQKDGLQCVVVSNLIDELNFPTRLVVGPTVREADGLAMSSRNVYLDATQRAVAPAVYAALCKLQDVHGLGERDPEALRRAAASVIAREPLMTLEYVSLADTADGQELMSRPWAARTRSPPSPCAWATSSSSTTCCSPRTEARVRRGAPGRARGAPGRGAGPEVAGGVVGARADRMRNGAHDTRAALRGRREGETRERVARRVWKMPDASLAFGVHYWNGW